MSHLTTFENKSLINTNKELLGVALDELGIKLDYVNNTIKNTWITEKVGAAFIYNGERIAVGLNFNTNENGEEIVEVAGDFYGTGLRQEELTNKIAQVYQKHNIIKQCEEQSWFIDDESVVTNENGDIVISACRYA